MRPLPGRVRILLDTNVLVSGFLGRGGPSGQLLALWLEGAFTLVTSTYQLDELRRVCSYSRLEKKLRTPLREAFFRNVHVRAVVLEELPDVNLSIDPADNPILATAIAGAAELIVSGDKAHVLALKEAEGIQIATAREALAKVSERG